MSDAWGKVYADEIADMTDAELRVFVTLRTFANGKTGLCYPSNASIATRAGRSVRQVKRTLTALEDKGRIRREGKTTARKMHLTRADEWPKLDGQLGPIGVPSEPQLGPIGVPSTRADRCPPNRESEQSNPSTKGVGGGGRTTWLTPVYRAHEAAGFSFADDQRSKRAFAGSWSSELTRYHERFGKPGVTRDHIVAFLVWILDTEGARVVAKFAGDPLPAFAYLRAIMHNEDMRSRYRRYLKGQQLADLTDADIKRMAAS